jgi:hypothetical protein
MHPSVAIAWLFTRCAHLRRSQAKTLAHLAAAARRVGPVSLANIARQLLGTTPPNTRSNAPGVFAPTPASTSATPGTA